MSVSNTIRRKSLSRKFTVGGKVSVPFGSRWRVARIVEDRGKIGIGGRRILRVALKLQDVPDEQVFEIPADDVKIAPNTRKSKTH